jgi:hypothetical protein
MGAANPGQPGPPRPPLTKWSRCPNPCKCSPPRKRATRTFTVTAADGSYRFLGQSAGTTYQMDVLWPADLQPTSPTLVTVRLAQSVGAGAFNTDFGALPAPRPAPGSAGDPLSADWVDMVCVGLTPWALGRRARGPGDGGLSMF